MYSSTIIVGNVGRDAELRFTPSGVEVADFSLAVNRRWTDRDGNPQERTTWFKVICWRKLAEIAAQYIKKGKLILVEGEVEASAFTGTRRRSPRYPGADRQQLQVLRRPPRQRRRRGRDANVPEIGG